jgi:hypothetical protein
MANPYIPEAERVKNAELLEQVRQLALVPLADMFQEILDALTAALRERAGESGASQIDLIEGMHEVRRRREQVLTRFRAHLANAWQALEAGRPLSVEYKLAQGGDAYSLVSHQELEIRLAVRRLADTVAYEWRPELMRLNTYMGLIAGGVKLDADTLPFGPHHIGAAIYDAFAACALTHGARVIVIEACEQQWLERIGALYATLEKGLVRVARATDAAMLKPRKRARIPHASAAQGGDESPDWIARFFSRWDSPVAPGSASVAAPNQQHARSSDEVLPKPLHQLLQRARRTAVVEEAEAQEKRALSQRELLSVLSLMQSAPGETLSSSPVPAHRLEQRLKWEVLAGAGRLGIDARRVRLEPVDEDAIDLIGMLFDVMLDECHLRGRIRELMLRLPVPYVKVALLDRDLFLRSSHPARRLLNLLAEASEHCSGSEPAEVALLEHIDQAIDRLSVDFSENLEIFGAVEQTFGAHYAQFRRRIDIAERRATEMHRAQERRAQARRLADAELAGRVHRRELPAAISGFLHQYWLPYVGMVALRGEAGTADMTEALALADRLLEELDLARMHGAGKPWLQSLRPSLTRMFASLGCSAETSSAVTNTLQQSLQALADDAERLPDLPQAVEAVPQLDVEPEPQAWVEAEVPQEVDEVTADYFRQLPLGTWLDFVNRDGSVQAGKLTWISPISARLMFVNRRGARFCVASASELAAMAQLDRLRLHRDQDAFYSAMQGAIDRLET